MLTVSVVASSTLAISISQRMQQITYFNDLSYQVASSIFQASKSVGCGMATGGDSIFDNKVKNNCLAVDQGSGTEIELNGANGLILPLSDGDNYIYSPNRSSTDPNRVKLKIKFRTSYLNVDQLNSTSSDSCNANSQPDLFRRSIDITAVRGSSVITRKKFVDIQALDLSNQRYNPETHGSILIKNIPNNYYVPLQTNIGTIYRLSDSGGCAWFPFLNINSSYTIDNEGSSRVISNNGVVVKVK